MSYMNVSARNEAQKRAFAALKNDKPFLFLTGPAGTGKTLIVQAYGMEATLDKTYRDLIYTRLQVQLGVDIGALPGDLGEKTYPFVRPFMDNLKPMGDIGKQAFNALTMRKQLHFDPIQTLRGGTFHDTFAIIDEAQNFDVHTMHGTATRVGTRSKIIYCGNFSQIDVPTLRRAEDNGLYQLLDGLYREQAHDLFDHINFTSVERHRAITVVEKILRDHDMPVAFEKLECRGNCTPGDMLPPHIGD